MLGLRTATTLSGYSPCNLSSRLQQWCRHAASEAFRTCWLVAVSPSKLKAWRSLDICIFMSTPPQTLREGNTHKSIRAIDESLETCSRVPCDCVHEQWVKLGAVELVCDSARHVYALCLPRRRSRPACERSRDGFVYARAGACEIGSLKERQGTKDESCLWAVSA